jgi:hypothetical protein
MSGRPNSFSAEGEWVNVDAQEEEDKEGGEERIDAEGVEKRMAAMELEKARDKCGELEGKFARAEEESKTCRELLESREKEIEELKKKLTRAEEEASSLRAQVASATASAAAAASAAAEAAAAATAAPASRKDVESLEEELEAVKEREQLWKMCAQSKISYTSFEPGDFALFLPTSAGHFVAFNRGSPFRYLSPESLSAAKAMSGAGLPYVLGHVIEISEAEAIDSIGAEYTPTRPTPSPNTTHIHVFDILYCDFTVFGIGPPVTFRALLETTVLGEEHTRTHMMM